MFVELHLVQNFAPANLNRDDTNNPKDCEFGGTRRARISSQCLKRSMRQAPVFAATTSVPNATRTKRLIETVAKRIATRGKPYEEAVTALSALVTAYLSKLDSKNATLTAVLLHISEDELAAMEQATLDHWDELLAKDDDKAAKHIAKELTKAFAEHTSAPDVALFGRMLASNPELGLEATCQVAHAISTHRVNMEQDFYTAVDDLSPEDNAGAGMVGIIPFNSACFYRYLRIDWDHLVENLKGDAALARRTLEGLLRAAEEAVPSGKQNSFAANNPPSLALAVVREDGMGWNLVNAFEQPVRADRSGGYVKPSIEALDSYWGDLCRCYGTDTLRLVAMRTMREQELPNLGERIPGREDWLQAVLEAASGVPAEA